MTRGRTLKHQAPNSKETANSKHQVCRLGPERTWWGGLLLFAVWSFSAVGSLMFEVFAPHPLPSISPALFMRQPWLFLRVPGQNVTIRFKWSESTGPSDEPPSKVPPAPDLAECSSVAARLCLTVQKRVACFRYGS